MFEGKMVAKKCVVRILLFIMNHKKFLKALHVFYMKSVL